MQFGQEKELVWHNSNRMVDGECCFAPNNSYSLSFIYRVTGEIRAWGLVAVIWQEGKQAVWVAVTVFKLYGVTVRDEALDVALCRDVFWDDPQEDVIMHEPVHWRRVACVAVHPDTKVVMLVVVQWRNQCVGLFVPPKLLQLQENVFSFGKKSIDY